MPIVNVVLYIGKLKRCFCCVTLQIISQINFDGKFFINKTFELASFQVREKGFECRAFQNLFFLSLGSFTSK